MKNKKKIDEKVFNKWTLLINLAGVVFFVLYLALFMIFDIGLMYAIIPTSIFMVILSLFHLTSLQKVSKKLLRSMGDLFLILILICFDFRMGKMFPISLMSKIIYSLESLLFTYILPVVIITILSFILLKIKTKRGSL